jgi:8-oxo-dGTP pyrophosphatase MutT (NUDIX family)
LLFLKRDFMKSSELLLPPIFHKATKVLPVNERGLLLVGRRSDVESQRKFQLDFIGGKREVSDCCERGTGIRESVEEAGLLFDHSQLHMIRRDMSPSGKTEVTTFWLRVAGVITPDISGGEFSEVMFMDPMKVYNELKHEGQKAVLETLLTRAPLADLSRLCIQNVQFA